jgi:hypothetical protein
VNADNGVIIVAVLRLYSMNSEETVAIDLQNNTLWHRRQQGEGEWGAVLVGRGLPSICRRATADPLSGRSSLPGLLNQR